MRHFWLGSILLSTALSSSAVTLGRHSGAAVLGRPLDIRIETLLAPGEDADELCVRPEVYFGDTLVPQVTVGIQRSAPDAQPSLRVQTVQPINEPFVTVSVRIGCSAPFSRRYVLLADPLTAAQAAAEPSPPETAARPSPVAPAALSGADRSSAATPRTLAREQRSEPGASVVRRARPVPATRPRLELEPIDITLSIDRDPVLRLSPLLVSEPAADEASRQAAIALWKAINAAPEEILKDARRIAELEAEARKLREREAAQRDQLIQLQAQVDAGERYRTGAFVLGGMLLMVLAGVAFLWRRRASVTVAPAWWKGQMPDGVPSPAQGPSRRRLPVASTRPKPVRSPVLADLDLNLDEDSAFDPSPDHTGSAPGRSVNVKDAEIRRDFSPSALPQGRSVATEELFDVQQQADFFVSLGQHDQAIRILRDHLEESHEPSPLAYLDLLKIYHDQGHRDDYEALRTDFNLVFNAGVPPFGEFSHGSRGLEAYETAFSRIQALWPQPKVLDLIERSIFRDSQATEGEVFDLEAYRELLFLHAVAKEMIHREANQDPDGALVNDFQHTALKPLKAVTRPAPLGENLPMVGNERVTEPMPDASMVSGQIGLDVDLDALVEVSAFEASLPDVQTPVEPTVEAARQTRVDLDNPANLIDFEFLDFMPDPPNEKDRPKS